MSISGLALSRVSHQAFGALEAACVHVSMRVCTCIFLIPLNFSLSPFLVLPIRISVTHTHKCTHVPARRVQVCDSLGVLGTGHPLSVFPSAPSSELALVRGQTVTSICLVNTEISKAHPSPWQKIAQARPVSAKIACHTENIERIYLPGRRCEHKFAILRY